MKRKGNKTKDIIQLVIWLGIIVLANYLGNFVFHRFDLTSENRYSLTEATTEMVEELDDVIFIRVYLEGDLPAGFKRLRDATQEMLDEFRAYADGNVEYEFIDPSANPDEKTRMKVYQQLSDQGLQYTNLEYKEGGKRSEKIIFPGAIFTYKGKEIPVQLLKSQLGAPPEVMLNNSIQQLEYEISTAIRKLTREKTGSIAFIEGHGELSPMEVADITNSLSEFYHVNRVKIDGQLNSLEDYDAIVIARPDTLINEKDKFIIDQFIMNGGKALWLVEAVNATMDSLRTKNTTWAVPMSTNLEDQLFKYGIRINNDLIMDMRALPIPIVTGYMGNQPKQEMFPWYYSPLLMPQTDHPVVKNLDAIKTSFVNSIDTIGRKGISKTILLASSDYTKLVMAPTRVSFNILREKPDEKQYTKSHQPIAVLLEGKFESVFTNRIPPEITNNEDIGFKEMSEATKMIVISDGNIIKNRVSKNNKEYFPLGFDKYTNRQYGNKAFIMNAINYLCDDSGLIEARAKEIKLRLLDPKRIKKERFRWQVLNTAVPIILVLLFGLGQYFLRKKKYT